MAVHGWIVGEAAAGDQFLHPDARLGLQIVAPRQGRRADAAPFAVMGLKQPGLDLVRGSGRAGLGRVQLMDWLLDGDDSAWPKHLSGGWHHMGTTRMNEDPKQGVVDANCKVHGIANLSVAGGAVFPTGGAVNPTLTLVAMALRLSDHLKNNVVV